MSVDDFVFVNFFGIFLDYLGGKVSQGLYSTLYLINSNKNRKKVTTQLNGPVTFDKHFALQD